MNVRGRGRVKGKDIWRFLALVSCDAINGEKKFSTHIIYSGSLVLRDLLSIQVEIPRGQLET